MEVLFLGKTGLVFGATKFSRVGFLRLGGRSIEVLRVPGGGKCPEVFAFDTKREHIREGCCFHLNTLG